MQYCINCGSEVKDRFCPACGQSSASPSEIQSPPTPPVQSIAYANPGAASLDPIETQLMLDRAKSKSPGFAPVLGFFFPWAAAFYNGKPIQGTLFLITEVFFALLAFIGIGFFLLLFLGLFGAQINYKWAKETNEKALEQLLNQRRKAAGA